MAEQIYVNWGGQNIKLTWYPMKVLRDFKEVTSVHGFCFFKDKVLLADVKGRGWNIPGGHVEQGETPEEAFHREVFEEGYVRGEIHYLGAIEVSHEENPLFNPKGKYPLVGYQLFYRMDVDECLEFLGENESTSRTWVAPVEVPQVINDHELSLLVLQEALKKGEK